MLYKRAIGILLMLCMLLSFFIPTATAARVNVADLAAGTNTASVGADYGLADNVQDGVILHCWNWNYNTIKNNLAAIAAAGYTSLQVSPVQIAKEATSGRSYDGWWVYYQPGGLSMNTDSNSALGTKSDFTSLCTEAHKYGIFVIVDIVANHLGNRSNAGDLCDMAYSKEPNIANNWLFHNDGGANDGSAKSVVRGDIGMPDLQTENSAVQQRVLSLLKECIDCGADGFRFDAAKHIETPDDGDVKSNFWPTVLNGATSYAKSTKNKTPYYYGEILNTCGSGRSYASYTKMMSITDNTTGNDCRNAVANGNAGGAADAGYNSGQNANKVVLWAESHDTYANKEHESTYVSVDNINKTWAIVASRKDASALYLARPNSFSTKLGTADKTGWQYKEVAAVNKFHNYFIGQSESLGSSGSLAYVVRGNSGIVIVNVSGGSTSVNLSVGGLKDGSYKDAVSGGSFTVSGGRISGNMSSSGIAVVYNEVTTPTPTISQKGGTFKADSLSLTIGLANATSGTYSINGAAATAYTGTKTITIGAGVAVGSKVTVKLTATDGKTSSTETYTFTKADPSATGIFFDNSSTSWGNVYCYVYNTSGENAKWPGEKMTSEGGNLWSYEPKAGFTDCSVIFANGDGAQIPEAQQSGLVYSDSPMIFQNGSWKEYSPVTPPVPTATEKPTNPTTKPSEKPTTEPITNPQPGQKYLFGDVDFDDKATVKDASLVQKHCADISKLSGVALSVADVTGTQGVSIADATMIQKKTATLINKFSAGDYFYASGSQTDPSTRTDPTETAPTTAPQSSSKNTIYFDNKDNWGGVTAYCWSEGGGSLRDWPGKRMDYVSGSVYKITVDKKYDKIIFSNDGKSQTDDLAIPGSGQIYSYSSRSWSVYSGVSSTDPTEKPTRPGNTVTIKFIDTNGWGSAKLICWEDANPNAKKEIQMTSTGGNTYTAQVPNNYNRVFFTNGDQKTQDLNVPGVGGTYEYNAGWK